MRLTPMQFFIKLMENQSESQMSDEQLLKLFEAYTNKKYKSKYIIDQYRNYYNNGKISCQDGKKPKSKVGKY